MVRPTARKQVQSMAFGWDGQTSLTNRWDVSLCACVIKKRDGRASWLVCGYSAARRRKFFCSKILVLNQVFSIACWKLWRQRREAPVFWNSNWFGDFKKSVRWMLKNKIFLNIYILWTQCRIVLTVSSNKGSTDARLSSRVWSENQFLTIFIFFHICYHLHLQTGLLSLEFDLNLTICNSKISAEPSLCHGTSYDLWGMLPSQTLNKM